MKRIGVTGAFGFLGANLIQAVVAAQCDQRHWIRDARIVAFASRTDYHPLFDSSKLEVRRLNVLDYEGMVRSFAGLDAVAHFAGKIDYRSSLKRAVWDTDALGTKLLFDAALAAGVPKVLYVSSICALGRSAPGRMTDESSSPFGDSLWRGSFARPSEALAAVEASMKGDYRFLDRVRVAYFDAKLAGWELAKLYARERGLPVVTIFPGTAVGEGDTHRSISRLVDGVWEGSLRLCIDGGSSFVAASDVGRGALLALEKGRIGEGYILSGRDEHNLEYVEFMDIVATLARAEGRPAKRRPLKVPYCLAFGAASVAELVAPGIGLTKALILSGWDKNACSSAKARAELGYESAESLEPAILACRRFGRSRARERRVTVVFDSGYLLRALIASRIKR